MPSDHLHNHRQFRDLIRIMADQRGIAPALVEKDYWIMHCLYGLQQLGMKFQLKGGTSLSKGWQIIERFSEDIDILIEPPPDQDVRTNPNQRKPVHVKSRSDFYDWLARTIKVDGIVDVKRDPSFDNKDFFSAGIRLSYATVTGPIKDLREGVLLEVGFDDVAPNSEKDISSWAYDYAAGKVDITDNRARKVPCYDPGYTFVEKLQTVSTKFRRQQETKSSPLEFMRHYYDIYSLLDRLEVQVFIGTDAYKAHKQKRFPERDNQNIRENEAFMLSDPATRGTYATAFAASTGLYYGDKPTFEEVLARIAEWAGRL
jgi:hypothetical protein